jgi:hypothetical protein
MQKTCLCVCYIVYKCQTAIDDLDSSVIVVTALNAAAAADEYFIVNIFC